MKTCDCCGEDWEDSFFCEKCSRLATEERIGDEEWGGYHHDVCGNCCRCHLIASGDIVPPSAQGVCLDPLDSKDVPF